MFGATVSGNEYKHWLREEDAGLNFITPEIHKATLERFRDHKAGDLKRILTNTAASQPLCFNLIISLQQHQALADGLFSDLLGKKVTVVHLEPEFTPYTGKVLPEGNEKTSGHCYALPGFEPTSDESIGDQGYNRGTDADTAVFYTYGNGKKGVLLIEFKFIEPEFSVCASFAGSNRKHRGNPEGIENGSMRAAERVAVCNSGDFYGRMVEGKSALCGYNKYFNWELTKKSAVIDNNKIKSLSGCPCRYGLNQLWRNMLLAGQVAASRRCDEFGFWVFSPVENDRYLWKNGETEQQFRTILTGQGNDHFKKVYLEGVFDKLHEYVSNEQESLWLSEMERKYCLNR